MNIYVMNYLLSYQRSGNHWVRFIIEWFSNRPTLGCIDNPDGDPPIFTNYIDAEFNPLFEVNKNAIPIIRKAHTPKEIIRLKKEGVNELKEIQTKNKGLRRFFYIRNEKLIVIIRNPIECIYSHNNNMNETLIKKYIDIIDYYNNWDSNKMILYYEDLIENPKESIEKILDFLDLKKYKLEGFLKNIDKFSSLSVEMYINSSKGRAITKGKDINFYSKIIEDEKVFNLEQIKKKIKENISENSSKIISRYF